MGLKKIIASILFVAINTLIYAEEYSSLPEYGIESRSAQYFRERYQSGDLVHYLDNLDLYITYQSETTGQYNLADQLVFSVEGNSFKWNNYYLDGFRIDSRFFAGSTLYNPDMYNLDLELDYISSDLYFSSDYTTPNSVALGYNSGGVGGIAKGGDAFVHLFHETATDRAYVPIEFRNKVKGAGTLRANFDIKGKNKNYRQYIYGDFGVREQVFFNQKGINSYVPENYGHFQVNGQLPFTLGALFDNTNYIAHFSTRDNLYSEFYYGLEETAKSTNYSLSFYGTKQNSKIEYSSGLTFAVNSAEHQNINFSRNVIDLDGEAYDPYFMDGANYEFSHALTLNKKLNSWLNLTADCYNSFLYSNPTTTSFENVIYAQDVTQQDKDLLYLYRWSGKSYASGLLENSVGLSTEQQLSKSIKLRADLNLTLDGMLLEKESQIRPNFEAQLGFAINPCKWFSMELNLAKKRVKYNIDDIRYLSNSYMNGDIYYINDKNGDGNYQSGEKGGYFTSTGGAYRTAAKGLKQPSYFVLDIPINFTFGRHSFSFLQSYRKYWNSWTTRYDKSADQYGFYTTKTFEESGNQIELFYLNGGEQINYIVDQYPDGIMGEGLLNSSPYCFSSNIQYKYESPKFMFILAWQSYMVSGISTLGNGPLHNNLGALSESSANPNCYMVEENSQSAYRADGRLDQDRAYIARIFASYNINRNFSVAANLKFKDGQPFSSLHSDIYENSNGEKQIAIYPESTRGTNTLDGDFGRREDAFFNVDLRATYRWKMANRDFSLQATCYNIYDFGTELTEYIFEDSMLPEDGRCAMSLNIPRGFIFTFTMNL